MLESKQKYIVLIAMIWCLAKQKSKRLKNNIFLTTYMLQHFLEGVFGFVDKGMP